MCGYSDHWTVDCGWPRGSRVGLRKSLHANELIPQKKNAELEFGQRFLIAFGARVLQMKYFVLPFTKDEKYE